MVAEEGELVVRSSCATREDRARLQELFPEPPPPSFLVLSEIGPGGQSNILAISNLPVYYVWIDVLAWLRAVLPLV
jgi:hypothetical protein